jgi:competence protein ComGF
MEIEELIYLDKSMPKPMVALIVLDFLENKHTIVEFSIFFLWLSKELGDSNELANLIFEKNRLNQSRSKQLFAWLFRLVT